MGQQDRFDALALDYANRFGRSPAEWFSVPELVEPTRASADAQSAGHAPGDKYWSCPAILDAAALADAIARHADRQADSYINWQPLQHIDSSIAPAFAGQLNAWCGQSITLHWLGTDGLLAALQMCKVGGNPAADAAWWLIHLDMLCLLQERERFEEMALSYCTGFELSPPDWRPVACTLVQDDAFASSLALGAGPHSVHPDHAATSQNPYASYALSGNLTGHPTQTLTELAHEAATAAELTVSCQRLGRVDAEAACALMNWAAQCRTSGCAVRFVHLPRLVMVFFELIGMQQVARLSIGAH
jgi:ABC-type transporter Mla MlaB component